MKKLIALLLCGVLALSALAGCGKQPEGNPGDSQQKEEDGDKYEKKIFFTMTSVASLNGNTDNYQEKEIYKYIADKFNIETEVWASGWDISSEKESMWLNSGTMPDVMVWTTFSFASYLNAIDQGLIQALPDGWEEKWPNLAHLTEVSGIAEMLKVDGKTYAIPHAVFGNFYECNPKVQHNVIYFRKDWAKQVGLDHFGDDHTITLAELKEYLEKVKEAGLASMSGIGATSGDMRMQFAHNAGLPAYQPFYESEDGFKWTGNMDGVTGYIKTMQDWYKAGLIDVDFYNQSATYYENAFKAGQIAAISAGAGAMNIETMRKSYSENFTDRDAYEDVGLANLTAEDGTVYAAEELNYWTTSVFNPELDAETMERILDVMDYVSSKEGQITTLTGVPDVHWKYDEDGNPVMIEGAEKAEGCDTFILFGYCDDDYSYSGLRADLDPRNAKEAVELQQLKMNGTVFKYSGTYDLHTSDAKTNYSVNIVNKVTEIICDNLDVESEWSSFIENNKAMWEPLLNELNETYYGG